MYMESKRKELKWIDEVFLASSVFEWHSVKEFQDSLLTPSRKDDDHPLPRQNAQYKSIEGLPDPHI